MQPLYADLEVYHPPIYCGYLYEEFTLHVLVCMYSNEIPSDDNDSLGIGLYAHVQETQLAPCLISQFSCFFERSLVFNALLAPIDPRNEPADRTSGSIKTEFTVEERLVVTTLMPI